MPQCPCAELFKIGDDYKSKHHPTCKEAATKEVASYIAEALRAMANDLETGKVKFVSLAVGHYPDSNEPKTLTVTYTEN